MEQKKVWGSCGMRYKNTRSQTAITRSQTAISRPISGRYFIGKKFFFFVQTFVEPSGEQVECIQTLK